MRQNKIAISRATRAVLAGLALSLPMAKSANAVLISTTWVGTAADNQWTTSTNWNNGVPATGYNAIFNSTGVGTQIGLGGAVQALNSLNISGASSYTIGTTSGDTLNFDNSGQITFAGSVGSIISANMNVGTTGNVVVVNNSTNGSIITFSGNITGNAGVQYKQGAASTTGGVLIMGSSNYSGTTNLSASSTTPIFVGSNTAFGTGTLLFNNASNPAFQAVGTDINLANPVQLGSGWLIATNTVSPHNLTFSGPISMSTSSRTLTFNNFGTVCYVGASPNSSTITTSTTTGLNLALDPSNVSNGSNPAIVVLNDKIVDPATPPAATSTITYSPVSNNTPMGIVILNGASTYANNTIFSQQNTSGAAALQVELGVDTVMNGNTIVSGPFGKGQVTMQNSTSPTVLIPFGADRTIANNFSDASAGFAVATAPLSGTTVNVDPTSVPHNLTLTGAFTIGNSSAGRTITNNMANSALLNLGDPNNPNIITIVNTLQFQTQAATSGTNMVYDQLTGSSGLKVISSTVKLFNNNNYAGNTTLTGGKTYALNTSGSATGTGNVNLTGNGTLGSGGTLGGTGSISGLLTVSSPTTTAQGGIVAPGAAPSSAGTLHVGSMTMDPLGRYIFDYLQADNTVGSGINDLISGSGTLDLTNLSSTAEFDLNLNPLDNGGNANSYVLASFANGILSGGNPIANGTEVTNLFSISGSYPSDAHVFVEPGLTGGSSQALVLVPEPTSLGVIALAAIPALRRRRR